MALIEDTLFGRINKVDVAIQRIKAFDPIANGWADEPYYVAYSGGKDSDVLRILFQLAGVKHDLVHNHTTADAPETVRYVRSIPDIQISYPDTTMWKLIVKKLGPPTRVFRYCCSEFKEKGGGGRIVSTGVRWSESPRRASTRALAEIQHRDISKNLMLNSDNDEARRLFETCQIKGRKVINPIIDWSDEDVWELLGAERCPSNPLYQCGFKRVGCIGCPMATPKIVEMGFALHPKYKQAYVAAFDRMIIARHERDMPTKWQSGEEVLAWQHRR